ncbi:MAG: hypothetical protein HXY50_14245 [Ignavibacteriaceae bacterium]|nr:hypothetical protein [Ignavibacteriaceae bacterium]
MYFISILISLLLITKFDETPAQAFSNNLLNHGYTETTIAEIGNISITVEEFLNSFEFAPAFIKRKPDSKLRHINFMIKEKLLALDGYSRQIDTSEIAKEMLSAITDDIATEELFKKEILERINYTNEDIDSLVAKKQTEFEIRWIYSPNREEIENIYKLLYNRMSFDSIYFKQFSDTSIYLDERELKISEYSLELRNPLLSSKVAQLKPGEYSDYFYAYDGWYIIQLKNKWIDIITSETESGKFYNEAKSAFKKRKMDQLSDEYINNLLISANPIIKRNTFNVLRTYIASYTLSEDKYKEWNLKEKLEQALDSLRNPSANIIGNIILVEYNNGAITLEEFLKWYRIRDQYLKFDQANLQSFSLSLKNYIWQMLRDKLLTAKASEQNFYNSIEVKKQSAWWKDKITYSLIKNEILNSIRLDMKELKADTKLNASNSNFIQEELTKKMFYKLKELQKKFNVKVNKDVLNQISVSSEYDPKAVDFYFVKKGGVIPRTPFPTIDMEWSRWE